METDMYLAYVPPKEPCAGLIRSKTFSYRSIFSKTLLLDEAIASNVPSLAKQANFRSKQT